LRDAIKRVATMTRSYSRQSFKKASRRPVSWLLVKPQRKPRLALNALTKMALLPIAQDAAITIWKSRQQQEEQERQQEEQEQQQEEQERRSDSFFSFADLRRVDISHGSKGTNAMASLASLAMAVASRARLGDNGTLPRKGRLARKVAGS
jgi:hypothetical protein